MDGDDGDLARLDQLKTFRAPQLSPQTMATSLVDRVAVGLFEIGEPSLTPVHGGHQARQEVAAHRGQHVEQVPGFLARASSFKQAAFGQSIQSITQNPSGNTEAQLEVGESRDVIEDGLVEDHPRPGVAEQVGGLIDRIERCFAAWHRHG